MNYIALEAFDWTNLATLEFVTHILQTTDSKKFTIGYFGILRKRLTGLIMKYYYWDNSSVIELKD